jgi:hypothetical protein
VSSILGLFGLVLCAIVAALWVRSLVTAVLNQALKAEKDVHVTVRFMPWPRVEIAVKQSGDQKDGDSRALEQRDGEAPTPEPKQ